MLTSCTCELNITTLEDFKVAHRVFVFQFSTDYVRENLHFSVSMRSETFRRLKINCISLASLKKRLQSYLNAVFVDYSQGTEGRELWVPVAVKQGRSEVTKNDQKTLTYLANEKVWKVRSQP